MMKKTLAVCFFLLFCFSSGYGQDDADTMDVDIAVDTSRVVLPILPQIESPILKPQKIEVSPPEKKIEEPAQMLGPLPEIQPPIEKELPSSAQQEFETLPSVQPPQQIETPRSTVREFDLLPEVSTPQQVETPQPIEQMLSPLPPIQAPFKKELPQSTRWGFETLPSIRTPQQIERPRDFIQPFNPLPAIGVPSEKGKSLEEGQGWNLSPLPAISKPSVIHPTDNPGWEHARFAFASLPKIPAPSSQYSMAILQDFRGGLNQTDFPNKIADNEATEQKNFIWSPTGKLEPRPGFDKYNTTEFNVGKRIWGLYPYYTSDGDKILLAGVNEKLWADTNDARTVDVSVKTGLQSNNKYYDFETFKNKAIVAHEGDYPFWYDGDTTGDFGPVDSGWGSWGCFTTPPITSCSSYIVTSGKFYEEDVFIGYNIRVHFVASGNIRWFFILGNTFKTIYLDGWGGASCGAGPYTVEYDIYSTFYNIEEPFLRAEIIRLGTNCGCRDSILIDTCPPDSFVGTPYTIQAIDGDCAGEEHFLAYIGCFGSDSAWVIPTREFGNLSAGDSIKFVRKVFYKARIVEIYKNRVFFVDSEEDIIYFSKSNKIGDFDPDNYFTVETGASDKITALATFYDDQLGYKDQSRDCLVIFKENSIYKFVWNSIDDYYLVQVTDNIGCVASQSIVNVEGKYLLFLHTTGVYAFDGRTVTLVSKKIQPIIEEIHPSIHYTTAGYYDRHYYLSFPVTDESNDSTLIFNIDFGAWAKANIEASFFAQQSGVGDSVKLLFAHPSKTFIYEFGNATTDTGEAISLVYKSKAFDFNSIADRKRFTYFDVDYNLTSGNFTAYFYTNFGDSLRYNKTVLDSVSGYQYKRILLDADCLGRNFSFKITSSNHLELGKMGLKFKKIGE